ncbi:MAG: VIT1/CCC1 transporter family protein [Microthrixaceae bacterium]
MQGIYERRGLGPDLAAQVAEELMRRDTLGAHLRDELGLTDELRARPLQAAWSSFLSFTVGALLPIAAVAVSADSAAGDRAGGHDPGGADRVGCPGRMDGWRIDDTRQRRV